MGVIRTGLSIYYIFSIIILLIGVFITVVGIHEAPFVPSLSAREEQDSFQLNRWIVHNWIEPWHSYNFTLVFLTRCAVMMGLALFMTFIEYYFANVAHTPNFVQTTAAVAILALLGAVVSAFTLGILSDRVRRAPLVSMATIFMALASFTFVIFSSNCPLWPLGILFGLGYGAYTSVDWALSVDALPSMETVGKDLGLWTATMTLPAIVAPLLGSLIIAIATDYGHTALGYRLVFAAATLFLILAAICVLFVREGQEEGQASHQPQTKRRSINIGWRLAFQTRAGKARGFLRFWPFWEWLTSKVWHIQSIPHAPHNLMAIRLTHYKGQPIDLPDGVHIQAGDPIIELHFNNQGLLGLAEHASAWEYMQVIAENLHALAVWLQEPDFPAPNAQEIRAIYGLTLLSRGARRLGFTVRDRPKGVQAWLDRQFMTGLLVLYNPEGRSRLLQGTTYGTYPQETWMSRAELLRRYGSPPVVGM